MAPLIVEALMEVMRRPTVVGVATELVMFCGPIWVAILVGLFVGWAWRPKWALDLVGGAREVVASIPHEGSGGFNFNSVLGVPSFESFKAQLPTCISSLLSEHKKDVTELVVREEEEEPVGKKLAVTTTDLEYLTQLVEETDGGSEWVQMMDRTMPTFRYKAWRREPETGPLQYRSQTIFEDAMPELVRDFFWDDEHRVKLKWDDMLLYHEVKEECQTTGTAIVHWIRKFPFFCSNREYTIGRRIWESNGAFYCITKAVPYPSLPRQTKPRRVDHYYSSWCIRPAESMRDGRMTACEVLLFHFEDMGIPREIAKIGIRQGMWGCVKKVDPGLRAYEKLRENGAELSKSALRAHITTQVSAEYLRHLEGNNELSEIEDVKKEKQSGKAVSRYLLLGGAVALACTLDRGLLTKAVIFGVARRFARLPGR